MTIIIDSVTYDIPLETVSRKADILYKSAERTADGTLHSELIGVFYNFTVKAGMSANNISDYAALWVKLTEPVESHTITLPDETANGLTFTCYFANIADDVVKWYPTQSYFRSLTFSVIAISPARTPA